MLNEKLLIQLFIYIDLNPSLTSLFYPPITIYNIGFVVTFFWNYCECSITLITYLCFTKSYTNICWFFPTHIVKTISIFIKYKITVFGNDHNDLTYKGRMEKHWASIFSRPMAITRLQGGIEMDSPPQCTRSLFICDFLFIQNLYWGNCLLEVFLSQKLQSFQQFLKY